MLGPVIGGVLIGLFNWSSVFWVNVPIGVVGFVMAIIGVSESRDPAARHLDPTGIVLSAAGLFGVTFGFIEAANRAFRHRWCTGRSWRRGALLAVFVWWEHRCASPMAPPALLRDRGFRTSCSVYFLAYLALASVMFFVTLLFQDVKGWSALHTGLSWLIMNVPFIVMAQLSGRAHAGSRAAAWSWPAVSSPQGACSSSASSPRRRLSCWPARAMCFSAPATARWCRGSPVSPCGPSPWEPGVAAGILNASRQVGTSVGLGFVGFLGVRAASSTLDLEHCAAARGFAAGQPAALTQSVTSGDVAAVTAQLGPHAGQAATSAFVHGYSVAITVCALALRRGDGRHLRRPVATAQGGGCRRRLAGDLLTPPAWQQVRAKDARLPGPPTEGTTVMIRLSVLYPDGEGRDL